MSDQIEQKETYHDVEAQTLAPGAGQNSQEHFGANMSRQMSVQLSAEQFEKLYLQPGGIAAKGDLTKRLGNPTPVAVGCFLLVLTPFSIELMGWTGISASATVENIGAFLFLGAISLIICSVEEWVLGNTFTSVVFMTFGGFYGTFAYIWVPVYGVIEAAGGASSKDYNHALAIYFLIWAWITFVFTIAALRTNVVFFLLFFFLDICFWLLFVLYLRVGYGSLGTVNALQKSAGAFGFLTAVCGWIIFTAQIFAVNGIPIEIPLGDLSNFLSKKKKD